MICVSTGVHCIDLITPGSMVVQPGQSLTLTCQVSGYSLTDNSYATGWIRQREGKPMDWISHQWEEALGFSYSRDTSAGTVTLTGQSLQPEDTAVYYCVRRPTVRDNNRRVVQNYFLCLQPSLGTFSCLSITL
uniref:Ig-like domain-containing protein n=1 Tax=Labrus bergylta TaxID=56723 RepID=A0A3Q3GIH5_9LABR